MSFYERRILPHIINLGGCNLDRPIAALIEQAGFTIERLEKSYMKDAPKFAGFLYRGVATPGSQGV